MSKYWKRMMSKVFNSSNNTNIVVEVPLQIFFFSLWTFVSKIIKYFSLERIVQIWVLRLLFLESIFGSTIFEERKKKRSNLQKFRNFELLRLKKIIKAWRGAFDICLKQQYFCLFKSHNYWREKKTTRKPIFIFLVRPFIILPFDKRNVPKPIL